MMSGRLKRADDGAGEVVFAVGVEAGHLGGFAADERAAVGAAGFGDAADDGFDDVVFEPAGGEVVEEEERRGALDGDVVDAVVDEVGADGVVDAELEGDLELGAYAVGGGDQHGVGKLGQVEREEAAEAADLAQHLLVEGLAGEHLDALLGAVAGGDVDAGVGVRDGRFWAFCSGMRRPSRLGDVGSGDCLGGFGLEARATG